MAQLNIYENEKKMFLQQIREVLINSRDEPEKIIDTRLAKVIAKIRPDLEQDNWLYILWLDMVMQEKKVFGVFPKVESAATKKKDSEKKQLHLL